MAELREETIQLLLPFFKTEPVKKTRSKKIQKREDDIVYARDMEIGLFNSTIDYANEKGFPANWQARPFMNAYLTRTRGIVAALKYNPSLIESIHSGSKKPHEIATLSRHELAPERWKAIQDDILRKATSVADQPVCMSDQYTCGRCKKKNVSYYQLQTRSADEAITTFFQCLTPGCGGKWKM